MMKYVLKFRDKFICFSGLGLSSTEVTDISFASFLELKDAKKFKHELENMFVPYPKGSIQINKVVLEPVK